MQGEKRQPYDENIRVPLIVRGPGVPKNATTSSVALNIDMVIAYTSCYINIDLYTASNISGHGWI